MASSKWILLALSAAAYVISSDALDCYHCSYSGTAKVCNDDPVTGNANVDLRSTTSSGGSTACVLCYKEKTSTYGAHYVTRGCISATDDYTYPDKDGCYESEDYTSAREKEVCYCNSNSCNHASSMQALSILTTMAMVILCKIFH